MVYFPIIRSLGTLGAVILLGWWSRRGKMLSSQDTIALGAFVYNFALPALFFLEISRIDFKTMESGLVTLAVLPVAVISAVLAVLRVLRVLTKERFVLFGLSIVFGSNAFFGVPFFESLYGQWGLDRAVLTGSFLSIFGIIASLALFEYAAPQRKGLEFLARILKSPLMISILLGGLFSLFRPRGAFVPELVLPLGRAASGTAIFMLGMFVHDHFSLAVIKKALPPAMFRLIILPAVMGTVLFWFQGAGGSVRQFLLLQSGIPAAVSIAIFAQRYQYKVGELTGMVVLTSLASFVNLGVLYFVSAGL